VVPPQRSAALSATERKTYENDGFFHRAAVFDGGELAEIRSAVEAVARDLEARAPTGRAYTLDEHDFVELPETRLQIERETQKGDGRRLRVAEPVVHLHPRLDALVDDPRLVLPVQDLLGTPVALFTDKLNLKRPRIGSSFRWHQDAPYWAHAVAHVSRLPNVMLTLDDSDSTNGCLRLLRGSHRHGYLPNEEGNGRLGALFTHPDAVARFSVAEVGLPAGSLCFFHPFAVHGSAANRSESERRALVLTYQPAGFPMFQRTEKRPARPSPLGVCQEEPSDFG
jgi:ectoine hydroxylase-related dioxygenase (phytanoyl-CoA dioxygenase family)